MFTAFHHVFAEINPHTLIRIMISFSVMLGILFLFTITFFIYKTRFEKNKKLWQQSIASLISIAAYYNEDDDEYKEIIIQNEQLLKKTLFRQSLIDELMQARKALAGNSTDNLKHFYEILKLNIDSFKKLKNKKWHIKAKGIHELSLMGQEKYSKEIFRLTNHVHELVRNEAQCALIDFYHFSGLRFLNVTTYPISEWQQIHLLNKLVGVEPQNFDPIKKWLQSPNESVVNFSLRLAAFYNQYDVYPNVIDCLSNNNLQVKLNTLNYLRKIPRDDTAEKIVGDYNYDNKTYRLEIINALNDIGNENQINFLLNQLINIDNDIKVAAAKSLSTLHPDGTSFLHSHFFSDEYPWNAIFLQIENDHIT